MPDLWADTEALRHVLHHAHADVTARRAAGEQQAPSLSAQAMGEGFAAQGQRIVDALQRVHEGALQRLANRAQHLDALARLNDALAGAEEAHTEGLAGHDIR